MGTGGLIYISGSTDSPDLKVTSGAYQTGSWGPNDLFFAVIDRNSSTPVYSSYLGGEGREDGRGLAVGPTGLVYFAASTYSQLFPISGPAYRNVPQGFENIVIGVLDLNRPGLDALLYCTYLGGSVLDEVRQIALDANGKLLLTGWTLSADFPVTPNAFRRY